MTPDTRHEAYLKHVRRAEMARRGITVRQLADACGVDDAIVSHVLNGRRTGSAAGRAVQQTLAGWCGLAVNQLWEDTPNETETQPVDGHSGVGRGV